MRKTGSERIAHGMRVKFNPLALLLDSSLEGEFDLVQRIIYEVSFINTTLYLILKLKIESYYREILFLNFLFWDYGVVERCIEHALKQAVLF